ncbi:MAG: NUDIX domain-containing protein [FCB group bacterium]|nr:NUDIX domain-containing protein [FCB group bacterium]
MTKPVIRIVDAYVYRREDDDFLFLLLKRKRNKNYGGLWQGVAGKIQPGESAWQAAVRELKEETGLVPAGIFTADHVSMFYEAHNDQVNLVPVFGIEVERKQVMLSNEHSRYRWVTFEEARRLLVWRGQKTGIRTVYEMLKQKDARLPWVTINIDQKTK